MNQPLPRAPSSTPSSAPPGGAVERMNRTTTRFHPSLASFLYLSASDVLVKNTITGEHAENTLKVFRICGRENTRENLGGSEWRV
ncbi:hypothetical protein HanRHA438_Chr15g0700941 [Helianthus annuus]|nr:hypothetical protein HanRHA438_Chr15g0700941 [Helianthus annuus]